MKRQRNRIGCWFIPLFLLPFLLFSENPVSTQDDGSAVTKKDKHKILFESNQKLTAEEREVLPFEDSLILASTKKSNRGFSTMLFNSESHYPKDNERNRKQQYSKDSTQREHLVEEITEDLSQAAHQEFEGSKGGPEYNKLALVSSPVRGGKHAFRHWVHHDGERSELRGNATEINETYWYGWSMFLPDTFDERDSDTILMQLAAWPTSRSGFPCGGVGSLLETKPDGRLIMHLQHKGEQRDMVCDEFVLAEDVEQLKGHWVDFVMHAKWTGNKDGFFRMWMRPIDEEFVQLADYTGRTWWNDEDKGPYFKMGCYTGEPGWEGPASRTVYTDEYRLGSAKATFHDVAPGNSMLRSQHVDVKTSQVEENRIRPYTENHWYWQYKGEPVLLLGGSDHHNLFNQPNLNDEPLAKHLDALVAADGNYVRNTMSDREGEAVYAFARTDDGRFDLTRWNDEYWERFEHFLQQTHERGIIVELELWDPWDFRASLWEDHPFNPVNNVNYTTGSTGLQTSIEGNPSSEPSGLAFFLTVPELQDIPAVLRYQQAFVDKVLSIALEYPNVLYCIHNEIGEPVEWGAYWARHVRQRAEEAGVEVHVTDMRRTNNINDKDHRYIHDRPELFSFIEVSQNNGGHNPDFWDDAEAWHWGRLIELRTYLQDNDLARPINNNKIYGHESEDSWGGADQGVQKFWRNLFAGAASVRFHRPPSGIGLNELARAHIRSARMWSDTFDVFRSEPDAHHDLLDDREANEAYLMYVPCEQYAVYFPDGGEVTLDLSEAEGSFTLRWLNASEGIWKDGGTAEGSRTIELATPGEGHWVAVLQR